MKAKDELKIGEIMTGKFNTPRLKPLIGFTLRVKFFNRHYTTTAVLMDVIGRTREIEIAGDYFGFSRLKSIEIIEIK